MEKLRYLLHRWLKGLKGALWIGQALLEITYTELKTLEWDIFNPNT